MKVFFLVFCTFLFFGCHKNDDPKIMVIPKVGLDERIYLSVSDFKGRFKIVDSVTVTQNLRPFIFRVRELDKVYRISSSFNLFKVELINDRKDVTVSIDFFDRTASVSNSLATDNLIKFDHLQAKLMLKLQKMHKQGKGVQTYYLSEKLKNNYINYADTVSNPAAFLLVYKNVDFGKDYSALNKFIQRAKKRFIGNQSVVQLYSEVIDYLYIMKNDLEIGDTFPQFSLKNQDGKSTSVFENKAEIYLIDFWASWYPKCIPCNEDKRKIQKDMSKFGVSVVSIAIENDVLSWKDYVNREKFNWVQLIDTNLWRGVAVMKSQIDSIPSNFVVSSNRVILAKNIPCQRLFVDVKLLRSNLKVR